MSRIKTSNVSNLVSNFLPFSVFLAEMNPGLIPVQTVHVLFISKLWKLINANKTENVGILWLYDICIFSIINYFSLFFLSVSSFHTKRSLSVRWVLPQVCCPDVTFDSHHWCEHLPTARPQTPVGRLHRVLQEETHRQRSAAAPFDLSYEKQNICSPCVSAPPARRTAPAPAPRPGLRRGAWPGWRRALRSAERGLGFRWRGRCSSSRCCCRQRARRLHSPSEELKHGGKHHVRSVPEDSGSNLNSD